MVRISKNISNIALVTGLLVSVSCFGMEEDAHQKFRNAAIIETQKKLQDNIDNYPPSFFSRMMRAKDEFAIKTLEDANNSHMFENNADAYVYLYYDISTNMFNKIDEQELKDISQPTIIKESTEIPKNPVKFPKIPTPNHITILSKEVAKDKIAAFKAMMNATPAIIVVKDLETLKNPDIKKIREINNYTVFGDSLNHKWVVDNETGIDVALSQEMIEKVMQLSTENIEFMLENNAFNEKSIDNILEWMNKNQ